MDFRNLLEDASALIFPQTHRAVRLRFAGRAAALFDGVLVPQRVEISEGICENTVAHITCLSTRTDLPLAQLQGLPIEIGIVTDVGELRRFDVVLTQVQQGQSDGALTAFQLTGRDIFSVMDGRRSNRVFLDQSALDIVRAVLDGWRSRFAALAHAFDYQLLGIDERQYPPRAFTLQAHQSDAQFLRMLLKRNGIAWFFRPGPDADASPAQQLVLFDDARQLPPNRAGAIRYHRRDASEPFDTVSLLAPAQTLVSGQVMRSSWDHETGQVDVCTESHARALDQGEAGQEWASALVDARIELPHAGDSFADHARLTRLDMQRHEGQAQRLHGVGGVRAQAVGEWNRIDGHAALDALAPEAREYTTVQLRTWCENNWPKVLNERAQALLAGSEASLRDWVPRSGERASAAHDTRSSDTHSPDTSQRQVNRFVAVRRDLPILPSWDPVVDLPRMEAMTASVVGSDGSPVWCDALGRVKVRIHGLEPDDAGHGDSAWVRVNFLWCGDGFGILFPLRAGMEVSLGFEQGDPSRPMIIGSRYNARNPPPRFDHLGSLPGNSALSGIVTRELRGARQQQLRFNDTPGDISTQLASDHACSQLNLGSLATPMTQGRTEPRGEGAELRSDAAVAVRGGQGVLISSAASPGAGGTQLARDELVGLARTLQAIVEELGALAKTHQASGTDPTRFRQLVGHLQDWERGSKTAAGQGTGGGAPVVAVSAAAGAVVISQDNLVLGAQTQVDVVSAGHTQLIAGQQIRQQAASGVSVFTHSGGIEAVAGKGLVDIQAHQGSIQLMASDTITLTAGIKVVIQAPEVHIIGQGTQTQWAAGDIVEQASGAFVVKAASFAQTSGGAGVPEGVRMPKSELQTDERCRVTRAGSGEGVPGCRYTAYRIADGSLLGSGVTDEDGYTREFKGIGIDAIRLVAYPQEENQAPTWPHQN